MLFLSVLSASAEPRSSAVTATGTLYFEFDMTAETKADGVNFAKFVPDEKSLLLFRAVTTGPYASPVRYVSFEPADRVLEKTLGKAEAEHVSHGTQSQIQLPVTVRFKRFRTEIECDSRVYYADLVSVTSSELYTVASNDSVPSGC